MATPTHSDKAIKEHPYLNRNTYFTEADYLAARKRIDAKRSDYDALHKPPKVSNKKKR